MIYLTVAVILPLTCVTDFPSAEAVTSTVARGIPCGFASFLLSKLDSDAESRSARTGISIPFRSMTRRDTVSRKTVLFLDWTAMLTPEGRAIAIAVESCCCVGSFVMST